MAPINYNTTSVDKILYGSTEIDSLYRGVAEAYSAFSIATWSYVDSSTSTNGTIRIPTSAAIGDLCVLYDVTVNASRTTPTGFTTILSTNSVFENVFSYKVLVSGDPGAFLSGSSGVNAYTVKIMMVFRPSTAVTITTGTLQSTIETSGNPAAITVNTSAITESGVAIGVAKIYNSSAINASGTGNWNATSVYHRSTNSTPARAAMFYKLQNAGSLTNPTLDIPDQGSYNTLLGIYFEGTG